MHCARLRYITMDYNGLLTIAACYNGLPWIIIAYHGSWSVPSQSPESLTTPKGMAQVWRIPYPLVVMYYHGLWIVGGARERSWTVEDYNAARWITMNCYGWPWNTFDIRVKTFPNLPQIHFWLQGVLLGSPEPKTTKMKTHGPKITSTGPRKLLPEYAQRWVTERF